MRTAKEIAADLVRVEQTIDGILASNVANKTADEKVGLTAALMEARREWNALWQERDAYEAGKP